LADADALVDEVLTRRPGWFDARWLRVAINHRAQRWSDVVRLLTPVVTDVLTVLEFTGDPTQPQLVVGCAVQTGERPGIKAPVPGLTQQRGRHRPALQALSPVSSVRLDGGPVDALDVLFERPLVEHEIP
jgi:hypothetical protein